MKKTMYCGDKVKGIYCNVPYTGVIKDFRDVSFCGRQNSIIVIELDCEIMVFGEPRKTIEIYEKNKFEFMNVQEA